MLLLALHSPSRKTKNPLPPVLLLPILLASPGAQVPTSSSPVAVRVPAGEALLMLQECPQALGV